MEQTLKFKSNTARAILGAAGTFKHTHKVVWEYVVNEIQYRNKLIKAKVYVEANKNKVSIRGNGSGMDMSDLNHFFTMHAENGERKKGNPGRGLFGTGKSAVFGIAEEFILTTVKKGKKYKIRISVKDIKKYSSSGEDIPLKDYILIKGEKTRETSGTLIEINKIFKSVKVDEEEIIDNIEKHLRYEKGAEVWVNNHQCEPKEPIIKKEYIFNSKKNKFDDLLGNIDLIIKVASQPLEKKHQGVSILSKGNFYQLTLAGAENKEMSNHLFGEIDCPNLDDDDAEISPFSMSRDMELNTQNPVVRKIMAFIGLKVEEVRKILVEDDEKQKKSEEAKKLEKHEEAVSKIINEHFLKYKDKIKMKFLSKRKGLSGLVTTETSENKNKNENSSLTLGKDLEAILDLGNSSSGEFDLNSDKSNTSENEKKLLNKNLKEKINEKQIAQKTNGGSGKKSSGASKFEVKYRNHGKDNSRAKFIMGENTVYINLEHPYIASLKGKNVEDPLFAKITYEIAFTEYAVGLVRLLYTNKYFIENVDEYLAEVREIVNALSIPFTNRKTSL